MQNQMMDLKLTNETLFPVQSGKEHITYRQGHVRSLPVPPGYSVQCNFQSVLFPECCAGCITSYCCLETLLQVRYLYCTFYRYVTCILPCIIPVCYLLQVCYPYVTLYNYTCILPFTGMLPVFYLVL